MSEPTPGDTAICSQCGGQIIFIGPAWDHPGVIKPKHPALPLEHTGIAHDAASADSLLTINADLSRQIGEQNTTIGYQDAMLARFEAELSHLNARQFAAFTLIGRLDYFLETYASQPAAAHKKLAAQLRREIAALTTTKANDHA